MHYDVLESRPAPHQFRAQTLVNLALCLRYRFEISGTLADIDAAIANNSEAFNLRPSAHPYHLFSLTRLGIDFHTRFQHTGNCDDLTEAISDLRKVIDLCLDLTENSSTSSAPSETPSERALRKKGASKTWPMRLICSNLELPNILHNLGATLLTQYEQTQSQETLAEAIDIHRAALKLRLGPNPPLHHQFRDSKKQEALDEALALYTEALGLCGTTHPSRSIAVEGLADVLYRAAHPDFVIQIWTQRDGVKQFGNRLRCKGKACLIDEM
ncbi:hypothetical protein BJ912DRAFT_1006475 [Pholiota molesta]|nr:hypothetical protein BJ912DRAFT_1006475 [Pholiota molesta]